MTIEQIKGIEHKVTYPFSRRKGVANKGITRLFLFEKPLGHNGRNKKKVVVEVDEFFGKPGYPMHANFKWIGVEKRKIRFIHEILMPYDLQLFSFLIEPLWKMPPSYQMDTPHPGSEPLYTPKKIAQRSPLPKAHTSGVPSACIMCTLFLPCRITAIHPKYHDIDLSHLFFDS